MNRVVEVEQLELVLDLFAHRTALRDDTRPPQVVFPVAFLTTDLYVTTSLIMPTVECVIIGVEATDVFRCPAFRKSYLVQSLKTWQSTALGTSETEQLKPSDRRW